MVSKVLATFVKQLVKDVETSKISWSKIWSIITASLGSVVLLNEQLVAVGISIPAQLLPVFKGAAIISALITAIRLRNSASTPAAPEV